MIKEVTIPFTTATSAPSADSDNTETFGFTSPVAENSDLPAILGLNSMKKLRTLIDTNTNMLIMLPQTAKGYNLQFPIGTKFVQLETAQSGHVFLPSSHLH